MRAFRFSFAVAGIDSREGFVSRCRRGEQLGYDTVYAPDHLGGPAPFPALVAAAEATQRLRVGTLVVNAGLWNPHLLAREVATVDKLTDGRLDLGIGAGHMRWEFDAAGITWEPIRERTARLVATVDELGRLFAGEGYAADTSGRNEPETVQRQGFRGYGPPLLIGGGSDRVLRLAAERADIVGFSGVRQAPGAPAGTLRLCTAAQAEKQVALVREVAGRAADEQEYQALVQFVRVTGDRRAVATQLAADRLSYLSVDEILDSPFLLIGTTAQLTAQLRAQRERFGFGHISVPDPYLTALAPIIEELH